MRVDGGAIPTCVSCSLGGNIVAIGYTDEKIRVMDMRVSENKRQVIELCGSHSDIIKCVKLSPDGLVCLSAGSDCTFRVWELSHRRCILTHGSESTIKKFSTYHKDSITCMDVNFDTDIAYTGGRDGSIF